MKRRLVTDAALSLVVFLGFARNAYAADYWVGPPGVANGAGTQGAPFATIRAAAQRVAAGDTVHIHGGTYAESIVPASGGNANAWVTFEAVAGELPILDAGSGAGTGMSAGGTTGYVRFIGIASRRWNSSGFDNGFNNSAGHVQYINCIADNNGINGIAFYKATGVLIQNSIIVHNGNQMPSWSSGVNLFTAGGTATDNQVIGNVSFENVDITTAHSTPAGGPTDGSGFILDQNSTGALFENNIGFHNGGSCIRITNSTGVRIINNTCYHDAAEPGDRTPSNPAEILFSQPSNATNVVVTNNLLVPASNTALSPTSATGATFVKNLSVAGALVDPAAANFTLAATATTVIDQADVATAPSTDIGFDPKCVTTDATRAASIVGQAISWWSYYVDYTYVNSVGGVAGCFHPAARPQSAGPDVGAYEFGGVPIDAGAGSSSSGSSSGSPSSSGSGSSGGRSSSSSGASGSGASSGGASSGGASSGGASSGVVTDAGVAGTGPSSSGSAGSSGSAAGGGSNGSGSGATASGSGGTGDVADGGGFAAGSGGSGCGCRTATETDSSLGWIAGVGLSAAGIRRRRRRCRAANAVSS